MSIYDVRLKRDTAKEATLRINARNAKIAGELARKIATEDTNLVWRLSSDISDVKIDVVSKISKNKVKEMLVVEPDSTNNIEFVNEIMESSQFGALAEIFVLNAITKFSKVMLDASNEDLRALDNNLIRSTAWQGVAREIHDKLEKRFKEKI